MLIHLFKYSLYLLLSAKEEKDAVMKSCDQEAESWRTDSAEVKRVQPILEDTVEHWKRFVACVDILTTFLAEGEQVMKMSPEEKLAFFADQADIEEKQKYLRESGDHLVSVTKEPLATEIKETVDNLCVRFVDLSDSYNTFQQVEVIGKARQDYGLGVDRISDWLSQTEELLNAEVLCVHGPLKDHLQDIDVS